VGVPVVVSVAGPLESGVRIAEAAGITLVGFVRGRRLNVYTPGGRVVG
jgi:FdhD protein